jgi:hypothetical protein
MSTVIKVENPSKRLRPSVVNRDMLYKDLQSRWAKFRGKEDPDAPIGLKHDKRLEHGEDFWALRRSCSMKRECSPTTGISISSKVSNELVGDGAAHHF